MKDNGFEAVIHHTLDDLPYRLKQAGPTISASPFWDEDHDDPPELGGIRPLFQTITYIICDGYYVLLLLFLFLGPIGHDS